MGKYSIINSTVGGSKIIINGKVIQVPSGNISILNNEIFINGEKFSGCESLNIKDSVLNITIEGDVDRIDCNGSVEVNGMVNGNVDCGGSVRIAGDIDGDIDCGGSVSIVGNHIGSIDAGGSVSVR